MSDIKIATLKDVETDSYAGLCSCGYNTTGWPKQKIASERIGQHFNEHQTGEFMEPLSEFRKRHGLVSNGNLAVFPEGAKEIKVKEETD